MKKQFDPNYENDEGQSYLHLFASNGETRLVKLFMDAGADVNKRDKYGLTPLHYAAFNGHLPIVRALFEKGARPNLRANCGRLPADLAREAKHDFVASYIKKRLH